MNNKVLIYLALILCTFSLIVRAEHSGVKFGIDTKIFEVLSKVNLNRFAANRTLLSENGTDIVKSSFPSYKIHLSNLSIVNVTNPTKVDVFTRVEGNEKYLNINLENIEVDLQTTFAIKVVSLFSDNGVNTPINVLLSKLESEFYFSEGMVRFNKLDVTIGQINIQFNSVFFKFIYSIAKPLIIKGINSAVSGLHKKLEEEINMFVSSQMLFDVGMGIGINATNVDRPELEIFNRSRTRVKSAGNVTTPVLNFLESYTRFNRLNEDTQSTILKFGIHGSIYPNLSPDLKPTINEAVDMKFLTYTFNNAISLLISDYSINTLLFMAQQTGSIKQEFTNETNTIFPFNIDTEGLSSVVPELAQKYNETAKLVQLKLYINPVNHMQPLIETHAEGAFITFNFGMDFNTFDSPDPWDDPVKDLQLNVTSKVKLQFVVSDQKLNILCYRSNVEKIDVKIDNLNVEAQNLKSKLSDLLTTIVKSFKPYLMGIDIIGQLETITGLKFSHMIVDAYENYIALSLDVNDI